jgi:hypothetical protein
MSVPTFYRFNNLGLAGQQYKQSKSRMFPLKVKGKDHLPWIIQQSSSATH